MFCQWNGILSIISNDAVAFWNIAMATFLFIRIIFEKKPPIYFEIICHVFIWPLSIFLGFIGFALDTPNAWFAPVSGYANCFVSDKHAAVRVYFVHIWVGISIGYSILVYGILTIYLCRLPKLPNESSLKKKKKSYNFDCIVSCHLLLPVDLADCWKNLSKSTNSGACCIYTIFSWNEPMERICGFPLVWNFAWNFQRMAFTMLFQKRETTAS